MITKKFITAGKAIFTVEVPPNHSNGKPHYTYRVVLKPAKNNYPDMYFVSVLTGPDNTKNYSYLGILNPTNGFVKTTEKSRFDKNSFVTRLLNRVLARVWANDTNIIEQNGFKLHHEGKCGRCGRKLTVPESIETGLGPECSNHIKD